MKFVCHRRKLVSRTAEKQSDEMMLLMICDGDDDDDDYEDGHDSGYVYDDENVDYRNRDDDDGLHQGWPFAWLCPR